MNYSSRFFLYGPVGLFALLMAGVMGYWWHASSAFAKKLDAANGKQIAPGVTFRFTRKTIGGFPFRVDAELDGLRVAVETSHGPTIWTADRFAMHTLTYDAGQTVAEAAGQQVVTWHDDRGALHTYSFLPGSMRASVITEAKDLSRFDLDLIDADSPDVAAAEIQLHVRRNPKIDALDVYVSANDVRLADDLKPAFGNRIKLLTLNGFVSPGSSFENLLSGRGDWRDSARNWKSRDGGLKIVGLQANWGPLTLSGQGALTLDDQDRPFGMIPLTIENWQAFLDQAKKQRIGSASKAGLGAALLQSLDNGAPHTDAPLKTSVSFKDGLVFVGNVPADTLSPLF